MKSAAPWLFDPSGWLRGRFIALLIAAFVVLIVLGVVALRRHECSTASQQIHRLTSYHVPGGCYVGIGNGQKVPLDNYNAFRGAR